MIFVILVFLLNFITKSQGYDDTGYFEEGFDEQQNCKNKTAIKILDKKGSCIDRQKSLDKCKIKLSEVLRDKCSATKVLNVSRYLKVNIFRAKACFEC